jgi:histidyl-tRNA synthetase
MITRVKGTQDFLDVTLLNFVLASIRSHVNKYHYTEIQTPLLEHTQLFTRSLGEQTDVVTKEMFSVEMRDKNEHVCLRPEATASIVRAFVENGIQQTPWKVFTYGPMFRYERPQKGRFRQFHQISFEVIGATGVAHDVDLIVMLDRLFHEVLMISDSALLINYLGCQADRLLYEQAVRTFLTPDRMAQLCSTCHDRVHKNLLRIFDCKNPTCQEIYATAPCTTDTLCNVCEQEWQQLQEWLEQLSVSYKHQPRLVRGLDYYSKTVFEFVSGALGAQNAFCAGGRYDQLVKQVGGKHDEPSVGAALGIERILLMLEPLKDRLPLPKPAALHILMPMGQPQIPVALILADELRADGYVTQVFADDSSLKSMMRHANKMNAAYALIIGDEEQQANEVMLKNMTTGNEQRVAQSAIVEFLQKQF